MILRAKQIAHAILAGTQGLVKSNTMYHIVEYSAGEEHKAKARHVILSPFWRQINSHTQIFHLRKGE